MNIFRYLITIPIIVRCIDNSVCNVSTSRFFTNELPIVPLISFSCLYVCRYLFYLEYFIHISYS